MESPYDGGAGPYDTVLEPALPEQEQGSLPSPEELAGTLQ